MNNLNDLIADLLGNARAYTTRAQRNGEGHADNGYLKAQAGRFAEAAFLIEDTIKAAALQAVPAVVLGPAKAA